MAANNAGAEYEPLQARLGMRASKIAELREELGLANNERLLIYIRHHWYLPVVRAIIPLFIALVSGIISFYRAAGGRFLITGLDAPRQLGQLEVITLVVAAVLFYIWMRSFEKKEVTRYLNIPLRWVYPIVIAGLLISFWFSYAYGGRLLYFDPLYARGQDWINYSLYGVIALMLFIFWLIWIDYRDTVLVLTNERVIYNEDVWKIRLIRQQIQITDIQQVSFKQSTYPAVILRYGDVIVQSFSQRKLLFFGATGAETMADAIRNEVNKLKKQQTPETLQALLLNQVYGEKIVKPNGNDRHDHRDAPREVRKPGKIVGWLFPLNPEELPNGDVIWRPAAIYIFFRIARPLLVSIALVTSVLFAGRAGLVTFGWGLFALVLILLVCGAWLWWLREELINDVYMLRPGEIVDVDKRPLGPVNRRSAPLDRIQNISFDTNFIESILGYGTVKIQTGGSGEFSFNHVPDPRGVQSRINDYLSAYRKLEKARQLGDAVSLLKEYETLRKKREIALDPARLDAHITTLLAGYTTSGGAAGGAATGDTDVIQSGDQVQLRPKRRGSIAGELLRRYLRKQRGS
jgi:Bacterial PH domain